ncbi:peptidoglycan DD-metalloendopeptidase family protein [Stygiobacter electus]|uniref:Peptidoglycan DD-metalloendopeptidase family protein n=1 Tax=Stygiobacter electus TaxID=3032292 RepID=A0AAE3P105_9BACT|nr:peptidoglycan DD-metalloendopeptidase family protein [Stygiobacter electus]MDF1611048.1 peptidoglycan DD-metalloendopeptidase family protein [Stygiobacter electus]
MIRNKYFLIITIPLLVLLFSCKKKESKIVNNIQQPNPFQLQIEGLISVKDTLQQNETLSDILQPHNISMNLIHEIEKRAIKVFPLRKFKAGNEIYIYAKWDSVETVKYLVYPIDEINYVVYDLRDSIKIYKKQIPHTIKTDLITGKIEQGLITDLEKKNIDPEVGFNTADIYESKIDFTTLQPGDEYKILAEQYYVDNKPVKFQKIVAAKINYKGKDFFAFNFKIGNKNGYYDENGKGMQGMFLTAPIKFRFRITSRYSKNRFHPVLQKNKAHLGTDFAAAYGTPIQATANGTVLEASYTSGNGYYIKIKHSPTYTTQYLHMSRFAAGIRKGVKVSQGQTIGYVGSTGLATGPHVCYRFWKNGKQVDPLKEKRQSTGPINKKYLSDFIKYKDEIIKKYFSS